ncbi:MAG: SpoIIE family protein phosphatase [Pseudohongiellaceae bacterium]|nr:SpoIIE family protein phosphatase [Pseudohongiellaceae bacterium]
MSGVSIGESNTEEVVDKGAALVLESDPFSYALLSASLDYLGYTLLGASSFEDAQSKLHECNVSLVVLDVSDDNFDSLSFAKLVKRFSQTYYLPVLCLSEEQDEEKALECIESGADDYIVKPFSVFSLKSRLLAMEKSRALHKALEKEHRALSKMHEEVQMDQMLAKRIFQRLIADRNTSIGNIQIRQTSATMFCGDLVLCAYLPNGGIRVLVGDFTGHGLAAALGAIPVSNIFHAMTYKGIGDYELLFEINRKLYELLPTDLFMAVCLVSLEAGEDSFSYWNGGMPPVLQVGDHGLRELKSFNLPLGITERLSAERQPIRVSVKENDRLLILSDGISEAEAENGDMFGETAVHACLNQGTDKEYLIDEVLERLEQHTKSAPQGDDITGVEISLWELIKMDRETLTEEQREDYWAWKITLENDRLASVLPVQNLLRESGLLAGYESQMTAIETIVDELYNNALDHGVLKLDSRIKTNENGFMQYYEKRDALLSGKIKGKITVALGSKESDKGKQIVITVSDSGGGFNYSRRPDPDPKEVDVKPWGRGLKLVKELSDSIEFSGYGNVVKVVYTCSK